MNVVLVFSRKNVRLNCCPAVSAALETALEPTYGHAPGAVGDNGDYSARLAFHNNLGFECGVRVHLTGMPNLRPFNVTGEKAFLERASK